jgi:hypothetical protein
VDLILLLDASSYTGPVYYKEITEVVKQIIQDSSKNIASLQIFVVHYASQASSTFLTDVTRMDLLSAFVQKTGQLPYQGGLPKVTAALDAVVKLKMLRAEAKKVIVCMGSCTPEASEFQSMVKQFRIFYTAGYQLYHVRGAQQKSQDILQRLFPSVNVIPLKIQMIAGGHDVIHVAEEVFNKGEKGKSNLKGVRECAFYFFVFSF